MIAKELIAQNPLEKRENSRMMYAQSADEIFGRSFLYFPKFLNKGDVVVLNNTKVFPARLFGRAKRARESSFF
jgi:S-adenosylmethionine:tRNA ribosyltransferase-isomerase